MMGDAELRTALCVASALNTLSVVVGILINDAKLRQLNANIAAAFDRSDSRFEKMRDPSRPT
jgi:hypothetical protein